ncbi:unnamed protein product [Brachionus calyciflorus]|uniref:Uncharacterized protein n=1 Tax=Brachionus calyciflorus TaxID=104777 RepID=A0A814F1N5_9BILA|nr:unnamed protein product [Brachionus calyciflorus]
MLQFLNKLPSLASSALNLNPIKCVIDQVRTRITCSKLNGKEKSVKTAMDRYFRLNKRVWIKAQPGYHHHLYLKPLEKRFILQQSVLLKKRESKMVERMAGRYYKKIKLENFVDQPFSLYHPYLNRVNQSISTVKKPQFFP